MNEHSRTPSTDERSGREGTERQGSEDRAQAQSDNRESSRGGPRSEQRDEQLLEEDSDDAEGL